MQASADFWRCTIITWLPQYVSSPSVDVRGIGINVSACLSVSLYVCLAVCPLVYLKNHTSKFHKIFCTCCLWLGSLLTTVQQCNMLCTSGFVDDAMFSHNGTNEAESKTTLFCRVRQVAAPGTKSNVYDCIVLFFVTEKHSITPQINYRSCNFLAPLR